VGGVLTVVGGLDVGGRNIAAGLVDAPVIEPVDVFGSGDLYLLRGALGPAGAMLLQVSATTGDGMDAWYA